MAGGESLINSLLSLVGVGAAMGGPATPNSGMGVGSVALSGDIFHMDQAGGEGGEGGRGGGGGDKGG